MHSRWREPCTYEWDAKECDKTFVFDKLGCDCVSVGTVSMRMQKAFNKESAGHVNMAQLKWLQPNMLHFSHTGQSHIFCLPGDSCGGWNACCCIDSPEWKKFHLIVLQATLQFCGIQKDLKLTDLLLKSASLDHICVSLTPEITCLQTALMSG